MPMTIKEAAKAAIEVQNACNISGVILSFADILQNTLRPYAYENGKSSEWVNQHPIVRMFCSKLVSLAEYDDATGFGAAYAEVQRLAAPAALPEAEPPISADEAAEIFGLPPAAPAAEGLPPYCPLCGSRNIEAFDAACIDWECFDCGELFVADCSGESC